MGAPTSSATIIFPANRMDSEIKHLLEKYYDVRFKPQIFGVTIELDETQYADREINFQEGLFIFADGEARYGEFYDLEALLIKKSIPFDRESSMDYDCPPQTRVFRPGDPPLDACVPDDESSGPLERLLKAARAVVPDITSYLRGAPQLIELQAAIQAAEVLLPAYPPLTNYVKEAESHVT